jgi:hypothetical protein
MPVEVSTTDGTIHINGRAGRPVALVLIEGAASA